MRGYKREYPPLTAEQQELINDYLDTDKTMMIPNYAPVKRAIRSVIRRHISPQEMEDYIGIAHLALMKAAACFNPNQKMSFASFATLNICSAIKTELTRQNTDGRLTDKRAKSLETPIGENEDMRIMDMLSCNGEIVVQEKRQIQQYLATLPEKAKTVLRLRLSGLDYLTIRKKMGYDTKQMKDVLLALQKYERASILYK